MSMRSDRARRRAARRRNQRILLIGVGVIILALLGLAVFNMLGGRLGAASTPTGPAGAGGPVTQTASGIQIEILQAGSGETARVGTNVTVHYTGWLEDGSMFDSSVERGQPATFLLASGSVIEGWVQGVDGMQIGEKRRLVIPPELAYGAGGRGSIPGNATLIFEVELLGVTP